MVEKIRYFGGAALSRTNRGRHRLRLWRAIVHLSALRSDDDRFRCCSGSASIEDCLEWPDGAELSAVLDRATRPTCGLWTMRTSARPWTTMHMVARRHGRASGRGAPTHRRVPQRTSRSPGLLRLPLTISPRPAQGRLSETHLVRWHGVAGLYWRRDRRRRCRPGAGRDQPAGTIGLGGDHGSSRWGRPNLLVDPAVVAAGRARREAIDEAQPVEVVSIGPGALLISAGGRSARYWICGARRAPQATGAGPMGRSIVDVHVAARRWRQAVMALDSGVAAATAELRSRRTRKRSTVWQIASMLSERSRCGRNSAPSSRGLRWKFERG